MGLDESAVGLRLEVFEKIGLRQDKPVEPGDSSASGRGRSGVSKISSAQIIWTQVVPDLERVLMTMSSLRKTKSSHRALSSSPDRYRTGCFVTLPR